MQTKKFLIGFFIISTVVFLLSFTKKDYGVSISNLKEQYGEVQIGEAIWMTKNLNEDHYKDGTPILEAQTAEEWKTANKRKVGAWCYYDFDPMYGNKRGKLYNYYAVWSYHGLAPKGWHVSTQSDWLKLTGDLGGATVAGGKIRSSTDWSKGPHNISINTDESGFNAIPAGYRDINAKFQNFWAGSNPVVNSTRVAKWWIAAGNPEEQEESKRIIYNLREGLNDYAGGGLGPMELGYFGYSFTCGFSVRCVKDND
jgi:uncharacterized protein (TIGR02145 family)